MMTEGKTVFSGRTISFISLAALCCLCVVLTWYSILFFFDVVYDGDGFYSPSVYKVILIYVSFLIFLPFIFPSLFLTLFWIIGLFLHWRVENILRYTINFYIFFTLFFLLLGWFPLEVMSMGSLSGFVSVIIMFHLVKAIMFSPVTFLVLAYFSMQKIAPKIVILSVIITTFGTIIVSPLWSWGMAYFVSWHAEKIAGTAPFCLEILDSGPETLEKLNDLNWFTIGKKLDDISYPLLVTKDVEQLKYYQWSGYDFVPLLISKSAFEHYGYILHCEPKPNFINQIPFW